LSDITIFQDETKGAKSGHIAYAFESDEAGKRFGISSLEPIFKTLNIRKNTKWWPRDQKGGKLPKCLAVKNCGNGGIFTSKNTRKCYSGFTDPAAQRLLARITALEMANVLQRTNASAKHRSLEMTAVFYQSHQV
jgi:hypothetical protein